MYFTQIIQNLMQPTILKLVTTASLLVAFLFGATYQEALAAVVMLIIFDTFLGVMAAYSRNETITSRKFSRVIQKGIVYFSSISAAYFTDMTIGWSVIQATMISFVAVTEFISVLESMGDMGFKTPNKLLNKLKDLQNDK